MMSHHSASWSPTRIRSALPDRYSHSRSIGQPRRDSTKLTADITTPANYRSQAHFNEWLKNSAAARKTSGTAMGREYRDSTDNGKG